MGMAGNDFDGDMSLRLAIFLSPALVARSRVFNLVDEELKG